MLGFPGGVGGKEPACQCRRYNRCGFNPWVMRGIRDNDPQPERSPRICPALNEVSRYRQLLRKERGPRWRVDGGGGTLEVLTPPDCWGRWYSLFSFHMEVTLA